jgi:nucleoside-diphosphate-sugar epimerase
MLVSVTGGTGYVGSHSVAALLRAGFHVRLLVRDKDAVARALNPLGAEPDAVEIQVGDVLDPAAVASFVSGADAVLHAASVYSFDSRKAAEMRRVNQVGTENVLGAARRAGVARIVHVSSVAALYPAQEPFIDGQSAVGRPRDTYMATKAEAETVARRHQSEGAPVLITYPPALLGPFDPHQGDQTSRLRDTLRGLMPIWPLGGFPLGDVRDTAALHVAVLTRPLDRHTRFFGPGRYLTTRQYVGALRRATGRRLPAVFMPGRAMLPVGRLADLLQRVWPWHIPAEHGAVYTCVHATPVAEHESTLGIEPRPVQETMADTVRWLQASGQLSPRRAGTSRLG